MNKTNLPYLVYTRKSTDDADNQKNSIPHQVDGCKRLAHYEQLTIAELSEVGFIDNGIIRENHTAYKTTDLGISTDGTITFKIERPKFQMMVQKLVTGKYAGVICMCWDRISRNDQDAMLIKQLMDSGLDFRFVQATYDKTSAGALHRDIDGMMALHHSRTTSEKVRNTFEKFRAEGRCIGPAPIGYLDHGSTKKDFDPERSPIVKRIFELYSTREWSFSQLAKWANQEGLTTKPWRARRTHQQILASVEHGEQISRPATSKTIENILKNPFYIGRHRTKAGTTWPCKHPHLIDTSLFNKTQEALRSRSVSIHYVDKDFYTFRNLISCKCGRAYSPYVQKDNLYYRARCKSGCNNPTPNLKESQINNEITDAFDRIRFTEEELIEIEAESPAGLEKIATLRNSQLGDLERQRRRIYGDLDYLKKNKITILRNNVSSMEDYTSDLARLDTELEDVNQKMETYSTSGQEMIETVLTFSELVKLASQLYKHALDSEKRELVTTAFTELVFTDGDFTLTPKDGFSALFQRHERTKNTQLALSEFSGLALQRGSNLFSVPNLIQKEGYGEDIRPIHQALS